MDDGQSELVEQDVPHCATGVGVGLAVGDDVAVAVGVGDIEAKAIWKFRLKDDIVAQ